MIVHQELCLVDLKFQEWNGKYEPKQLGEFSKRQVSR